MADLEDSNAPTWKIIEGQQNLEVLIKNNFVS
jgi:malate synthase